MKENFVHIVFVIDESGSMYNAVDDVIGGFKKVVDEQRENTNGTCAVSYYKFADKVKEVYLLKDINNVEYIITLKIIFNGLFTLNFDSFENLEKSMCNKYGVSAFLMNACFRAETIECLLN